MPDNVYRSPATKQCGYVTSEVTNHIGHTVELFATVVGDTSPFFSVMVNGGYGNSGSVNFSTFEEFKKFVDEVNWVVEQASEGR